jgi:hypothetical protein
MHTVYNKVSTPKNECCNTSAINYRQPVPVLSHTNNRYADTSKKSIRDEVMLETSVLSMTRAKHLHYAEIKPAH